MSADDDQRAAIAVVARRAVRELRDRVAGRSEPKAPDPVPVDEATAAELWERSGRVLRATEPEAYRELLGVVVGFAALVSGPDEN